MTSHILAFLAGPLFFEHVWLSRCRPSRSKPPPPHFRRPTAACPCPPRETCDFVVLEMRAGVQRPSHLTQVVVPHRRRSCDCRGGGGPATHGGPPGIKRAVSDAQDRHRWCVVSHCSLGDGRPGVGRSLLPPSLARSPAIPARHGMHISAALLCPRGAGDRVRAHGLARG